MTRLVLIPATKPDRNKLEEAYEVAEDLSVDHAGTTTWVPRFFQYDGASIPGPLWQLIGTPFNPRFVLAAVFHDWIYHTHDRDRKAADQLFYELLRESGVPKVKATLMREAVESFGAWYWDNDKDDRAYLSRLVTKIRTDGRDPAKYGLA